MNPVFLYEPLTDALLLETVVGVFDADSLKPARLNGFTITTAQGRFPGLVESDPETTVGVVAGGMSRQQLERLYYFAECLGLEPQSVDLTADSGPQEAIAFFACVDRRTGAKQPPATRQHPCKRYVNRDSCLA